MMKRYLNPQEAADYLRVGLSTLSIHRIKGTGPNFIRWASNIRYDIQDLDEWMAQRRVTPQEQSAASDHNPTESKHRTGRSRKTAHVPMEATA